MKQFNLFLTATLISIVFFLSDGFGQTITLHQLIDKTKCNDFTCFDNFIKGRKFSFFKKFENDSSSFYISYYYLSDEMFTSTSSSSSGSTDRNIAYITLNSNGSVETGFGTSVKSYLDTLMTDLKHLKFSSKGEKKFGTQSEKDGRAVSILNDSTIYPNIKITLNTTRRKNDNNENYSWWVSYRLSVEKIK